MVYIPCLFIIFSPSFGFSGTSVGPSATSQIQIDVLGGYGDPGSMSCPSCATAPAPQGYYPKFGIGGGGINANTTTTKRGVVGTTGSLFSKIIEQIPDNKVKNGLQEYMKIVNPDAYGGDDHVGQSNAGVAKYFRFRFQENQCFQSAAINFYNDVAAILRRQNVCPTGSQTLTNPDYGCSKGRPNVRDHTGSENSAYLDNGWLLRLAMKHSSENPVAALELIGMCGHDDINQGHFAYFDSSDAAKQKNINQLIKLKNKKKQVDEDLKKAFKIFNTSEENKAKVYNLGKQGSFLNREIKDLAADGLEGRYENLECPRQDSDFFLPGSLSSKADIAPTMVSKVKNIQGMDGRFIPAKYYHVYGSAFLGCKMVEKGLTPEQASTVQKQAARLYRGVRMCDAESKMLQERKTLQRILGSINLENSAQVERGVTKLWEQKLSREFTCNGTNNYLSSPNLSGNRKIENSPIKDSADNDTSKDDREKCSILILFDISDLDKSEKHIVSQKILKKLERVDAAKLYNDWYFGGGSVAGVKIPCSDIRYKGPIDLLKPNEGIMGKLFKPSGWTHDRYDAASKKLATFDVDFEWTVAQHEAGSKFGATLCADSKGKKNPFEQPSCLGNKSKPNLESIGKPILPDSDPNPMSSKGIK